MIEASADARLKPAKENVGSSFAAEHILSDDVTAAKNSPASVCCLNILPMGNNSSGKKKKNLTIFYQARECYRKYSYSHANIFLSITSVNQSTAGMNHNAAKPPFYVGSSVCGCLYATCEGSHVRGDLPGRFSVLPEIYGADEYLNHRQHTSQPTRCGNTQEACKM